MSQFKRSAYVARHKAEPRGLVAVLRRAVALASSAPASPLAVLKVEEEES